MVVELHCADSKVTVDFARTSAASVIKPDSQSLDVALLLHSAMWIHQAHAIKHTFLLWLRVGVDFPLWLYTACRLR